MANKRTESTEASNEAIPHQALKPFVFLGVDVAEKQGSNQAWGECPFCGKDNKFSINLNTTKWDCKVCGLHGNATSFLKQLWELSLENTNKANYEELAEHRKLLFPETLKAWGVCKSIITDEWLVPAFNTKMGLHQLYRYINIQNKDKKTWSYKLLPTPGLHEDGKVHGLFGYSNNLFSNKKKEVYICEGCWDGMALWETMARLRDFEGRYLQTTNIKASLLSNTNIIATPGANIFVGLWATVLEEREVTLLFDNDHPFKHRVTKKLIQGAGYLGTKRIIDLLHKSETPPSKVSWLNWGSIKTTIPTNKPNNANGNGHFVYHDPNLPTGFDVRDYLNNSPPNTINTNNNNTDNSTTTTEPEPINILSIPFRKVNLVSLFSRIQPIPIEWITGRFSGGAKNSADSTKGESNGKAVLEPIECKSWAILRNEWKKALKWTEGLDRALSIMLASITSTKAVGDQLWVKIIGPPSSGKSILCEALAVNRQYIFSRSTIRGFFSGYQSDDDGGKDHSLISKIDGMTLVTKDGDPLLQSPNKDQILSEARDIYDRNSRVEYRSKAGARVYENLSLTWILCGTSALRVLDTSELGARFIDCVIMEGIDDELENDILERVANRAFRNMSREVNGKAESQTDPIRARAMQLTGGYIQYLRENATIILSKLKMDLMYQKECIRLGKFVAYMRARPSIKQDETAERELAGRLVEQHIRLACCLGVVLQKSDVDEEVMRRVRQCAFDTARGKTLDITRVLAETGPRGMDGGSLSIMTNESPQKQIGMLRFLRKIGVVDVYSPVTAQGIRSVKKRWKLTQTMANLYEEVHAGLPSSI